MSRLCIVLRTTALLDCRQILSLKSEVFCSLLLSADLSENGSQTEVPLEDCTLAEANIFLRYIYMRDPVTDEYQAEGLTKVAPNICHHCSCHAALWQSIAKLHVQTALQ